MVQCFNDYPDVAQVRFPELLYGHEDSENDHNTPQLCFVLSYLTTTTALLNLAVIHAAYRAFPEAIACPISATGLPLHYACQQWQQLPQQWHKNKQTSEHFQETLLAIIHFLLSTYPDAARYQNVASGNTPLHLVCQTNDCNDAAAATQHIATWLLHACPHAVCVPNHNDGETPLHIVCRHPDTARSVVPLLLHCASTVVGVRVSSQTTGQRPLHIAVAHGCDLSVIQQLHQYDPKAIGCVDDTFQTVLHKAMVVGQPDLAVIQYLVQHYPDAVTIRDARDKTPIDVARARWNHWHTLARLLEPVSVAVNLRQPQ